MTSCLMLYYSNFAEAKWVRVRVCLCVRLHVHACLHACEHALLVCAWACTCTYLCYVCVSLSGRVPCVGFGVRTKHYYVITCISFASCCTVRWPCEFLGLGLDKILERYNVHFICIVRWPCEFLGLGLDKNLERYNMHFIRIVLHCEMTLQVFGLGLGQSIITL